MASCAAAVTRPPVTRRIATFPGKWRPTRPKLAPALGPGLTTVTGNRRARHTANVRWRQAGSIVEALRSTNPHNPFGTPSKAADGSGSRTGSENTHNGGTEVRADRGNRWRRALTAYAQEMSFRSMAPLSTETVLATNLRAILGRVAAAAAAVGRDPASITLVAVSKFHPADDVEAAWLAGQRHFGENRVQEAATKFGTLREACQGIQLHLIGPLQTNKAREAVAIADVIETLDRPRLADAIDAASQAAGRLPDLLVQVNVGDEPQKAGVPRADADRFIADSQARFGPALTGLMCIPPADADPAPHFAWLADRAAAHGLPVLSMGMSADFEAAIRQGATHIRVGTAIFGPR